MIGAWKGLEPLRALIKEAHDAGQLRRWAVLCRQHDAIVLDRLRDEARAGQPGDGCQVVIPVAATTAAVVP